MQHHSFFPEHNRNSDFLKQKSIEKKGPPTSSPDCLEYVQYAKAIMNKIAIEIGGSTGSDVAGELSENFDCEFGDVGNDNEDKYGISSEDSK